MAIRSIQGKTGRTMRVEIDHLGKVALFGLVMHVGVTIGRRGNAPIFVVLPPPVETPVETVTARPQKLVDPTPELLPGLDSDLPEMGTKEFNRRVKGMGLDPREVAMFSQMMKTQDLAAFRK